MKYIYLFIHCFLCIKTETKWDSIKISLQLYETQINSTERLFLEKIFKEAITKVSKILYVKTLEENLLLPRSNSSCNFFWRSGNNKDRCSSVKISTFDQTEICLDNFNIPPDHLQGLFEWPDKNLPINKVVLKNGTGISESNFVLYVQAISTKRCEESVNGLMAYTRFCKQNELGRPIAAYTNFCPHSIRNLGLSYKKATAVALHELLHALGFTNELFNDFKSCDFRGICSTYPNVIKYVNFGYRLVTPNVVKKTRNHFNCLRTNIFNEFGPILQIEQTGRIGSHWNSAFMFTSIMTPSILDVNNVVLDPITLAVFEDSGWYHVDYSKVDKFLWGKDAGCDFGLSETTEFSNCNFNKKNYGIYFCPTIDEIGCDFLYQDRGKCQSNNLMGCFNIIKSVPELSCDKNSLCYVSNLTKKSNFMIIDSTAYCLKSKCTTNNQLFLLLFGKWYHCPYDTVIFIDGYEGCLKCPPFSSNVCTFGSKIYEFETSTISTSTFFYYVDTNPTSRFTIQFHIQGRLQINKQSEEELKYYSDYINSKLSKMLGISIQRMIEPSISNKYLNTDSLLFEFLILPANKPSDGIIIDAAYQLIFKMIENDTFILRLENNVNLSGIYITYIPTSPKKNNYKQTEILIIVVICCIVSAFLFTFLVIYVQRRHLIYHIITRPLRRQQEAEQVN